MNKISRICLHITKVVLTIVLLCQLALTIIIHRHSWKYSIGTYSPIFCTIALIICFMIIKPDDLEENQYTQKISSKWKICLRIVSTMLTTIFLCRSALTIATHRHSWEYSINKYSPIFCIIAFIICFIYIKPKKWVRWTLIGSWLILLYRYLRRFISMIYNTDYAWVLPVLSISIISISAILIRKMIEIHDTIKIGKTWKWIIMILLFLVLWSLWLWLRKSFKVLYWSLCVKLESGGYKCCDLVSCHHEDIHYHNLIHKDNHTLYREWSYNNEINLINFDE